MMVGDIAKQPPAERADQKSRSEYHRGVELLHDGIGARKKGRCKIKRERSIGVEVIPLDEIADRAYENCFDPAFDVLNIEAVVSTQLCNLFRHLWFSWRS